MRVIYGIGNLSKGPAGKKVLTVGVFDGVHRGHRLILQKVVKEAKKRRMLSAVVTFASHPSYFFNPRQKISSLTSLEHKLLYMETEGIDLCYVFDFNKSFSNIGPEAFVENILFKKLRMVSFYVGEDFVFGRGSKGDKKLLLGFSKKFHFKAHIVKHLKLKNRIVSSTLIRDLIKKGQIDLARIFLGRPVSILGEVVKGEGRGKILGFPTANIRPHHEVLAPDGIYATLAICAGHLYKSVTYIGRKPTFRKKSKKRNIEVFLLGFKKNIYFKKIEVRFIKKIRDDKRFPSLNALVAQMRKDVSNAKKF